MLALAVPRAAMGVLAFDALCRDAVPHDLGMPKEGGLRSPAER